MEILVGLFVGIIIQAVLVAIYDWVKFGIPIGKRRIRRRKTSMKGSKEPDKTPRHDKEQADSSK